MDDSGQYGGKWIFAGTNLQPGSSFARGGIEADATTANSPRETEVIATIPNIFGTGQDAEMSYYELPNGAKVFAAGAFTLAGRAGTVGRQTGARESLDPTRRRRGLTGARWQRQLG